MLKQGALILEDWDSRVPCSCKRNNTQCSKGCQCTNCLHMPKTEGREDTCLPTWNCTRSGNNRHYRTRWGHRWASGLGFWSWRWEQYEWHYKCGGWSQWTRNMICKTLYYDYKKLFVHSSKSYCCEETIYTNATCTKFAIYITFISITHKSTRQHLVTATFIDHMIILLRLTHFCLTKHTRSAYKTLFPSTKKEAIPGQHHDLLNWRTQATVDIQVVNILLVSSALISFGFVSWWLLFLFTRKYLLLEVLHWFGSVWPVCNRHLDWCNLGVVYQWLDVLQTLLINISWHSSIATEYHDLPLMSLQMPLVET